MASKGKLSLVLCGGVWVVSLATLLHIVGMSTPHWAEYGLRDDETGKDVDGYTGLFEVCMERRMFNKEYAEYYKLTTCRDLDFDTITRRHRVLQVFAYLGMIFGITSGGAAIVLQLVMLLSARFTSKSVIASISVATVSSLLASGLIFSSVGIFSDRLQVNEKPEFRKETGYSIILCGISAVLFLLGAVLICASGKFIKVPDFKSEKTVEETIASPTALQTINE